MSLELQIPDPKIQYCAVICKYNTKPVCMGSDFLKSLLINPG